MCLFIQLIDNHCLKFSYQNVVLVLEQCVAVYNTDFIVCVEEETPHFKITMNFFKEVVTEGHELHVNFVIVLLQSAVPKC